jgi:hypothetical protein
VKRHADPAAAAAAIAGSSTSVNSHTVTLPPLHSEELAKATESAVLKQAIADSAREFIALRRDLEATLLKDVHLLDEHTLRLRIKQLATEMFERLAWEDLRMNQSLKGVQSELTEKFTDLMTRQRKELEFEVKKILFEYESEAASKSTEAAKLLEASYQKQMAEIVRAQADGFHATMERELQLQGEKIQTQLQNDLNHQVAEVRKAHIDELLALQPSIQLATAQLAQVKEAADATAAAIKQTMELHRLSHAVLSLEHVLSTSSSLAGGGSGGAAAGAIGKQFAAVQSACAGDEVVQAVLESLPRRVLESGALSLSDLQVRFVVMREEVRKAALAPEDAPKMLG